MTSRREQESKAENQNKHREVSADQTLMLEKTRTSADLARPALQPEDTQIFNLKDEVDKFLDTGY